MNTSDNDGMPETNCRRKNKTLEEVFQEINRRHVKIKKSHKKTNNSILFSVLDNLLRLMRNENALFNVMKPKLEMLGSYFDGLRVGEPTEYDINVILTLHLDYDKIVLNAKEIQNGYSSIVMPAEFRRLSKTPETAIKGFKDTEFWCDSSFRFSVTKFRSWMQSVVDTALYTLPKEKDKRILKVGNKLYKIEFKTSGPANTITIQTDSNNIIDVDLVPTLLFKLPKVPESTPIEFEKVAKTKLDQYFAVPKPTNDDFSWRLAFPYQERYYINNKNNLKSTLKLLKLLRDVQGFNKLASYFIKTLFLWEASEQSEHFWTIHSLSFLVLYMMRKLSDNLAAGRIKNFWCPEHNLLEKIRPQTCQNWANRLRHIINDIDHNGVKNPEVLVKYFTKVRK